MFKHFLELVDDTLVTLDLLILRLHLLLGNVHQGSLLNMHRWRHSLLRASTASGVKSLLLLLSGLLIFKVEAIHIDLLL